VLGVLVLGFAWALGRHLGAPHRGPVLLGVFGVSSCIANGLLPCDVACVGETPVAMAHNVTGLLGFVAAIAGMTVLARRWRHDPAGGTTSLPTVGAAVVALGGLGGSSPPSRPTPSTRSAVSHNGLRRRAPAVEPVREVRRLLSVRGWGHGTTEQVFTGGP
jgi:hypothetical protein